MPVFYRFNGIKVNIFFNEHLPPHIHVEYGEFEVLIDINNISIYQGKLPKSQLKKTLKYVKENQEDLLASFYECNPNIEKL